MGDKMEPYIKINSLFKRTPDGKKMLFGEYSQEEFSYLKDCKWTFTEKVDGMNTVIVYSGDEEHGDNLTFGGRTNNAQIPAHLVNRLNDLFTIDLLRKVFPSDNDTAERVVHLYGEGYGAKIQAAGKNYNPAGVDFVLFDVKISRWWLKREDVEDIASKLNIQAVPVIGQGTLDDLAVMCENGFKSRWGDFLAEGAVARPQVELFDRGGHRIITKLKHKDFHEITR